MYTNKHVTGLVVYNKWDYIVYIPQNMRFPEGKHTLYDFIYDLIAFFMAS